MLCAHETEVLSGLESETQVRYASREYSVNNSIDENFEAEASSHDHSIPEKESFLPPFGDCLTEREVTRYSISFVSTSKTFFLCESDEEALRKILVDEIDMIISLREKSHQKSQLPFSPWIEYTFAVVLSFQ